MNRVTDGCFFIAGLPFLIVAAIGMFLTGEGAEDGLAAMLLVGIVCGLAYWLIIEIIDGSNTSFVITWAIGSWIALSIFHFNPWIISLLILIIGILITGANRDERDSTATKIYDAVDRFHSDVGPPEPYEAIICKKCGGGSNVWISDWKNKRKPPKCVHCEEFLDRENKANNQSDNENDDRIVEIRK